MKKLKRLTEYFKSGVWQKQDGDFKNRKSFWLTRQLRVLIYTVRGINRHGSFIRSAALTFYTVMSLVPIMALAFGVIKGFGLDEQLNAYLFDRYPHYSNLIEGMTTFADGVLERTRGGVVAITGLVLLVWAAVRVFVNVEGAFNAIWEVKRQRSIARKASAYVGVIFVIPILWVGLSAIIMYVRNIIVQYTFLTNRFLYTVGSLVVIWGVFTLIYKAIPYTKVKWRYAMQAAGVASFAFIVFQAVYVYIQNGVSAYNIIYGSFAALPLFLLWVQISWQIVLLGAELSFSYQNIDSYLQERDAEDVSYDNRRKIMLASLLTVIKNFAQEKGGLTSEEVAKELKVPIRIVRDVLFDMDNAGLVMAAKSAESDKINIYLPAKDIHTITFYGALRAVEEYGVEIDERSDNLELDKIAEILDDIKDNVARSKENMPLMELLKDESNDTGKRERS